MEYQQDSLYRLALCNTISSIYTPIFVGYPIAKSVEYTELYGFGMVFPVLAGREI